MSQSDTASDGSNEKAAAKGGRKKREKSEKQKAKEAANKKSKEEREQHAKDGTAGFDPLVKLEALKQRTRGRDGRRLAESPPAWGDKGYHATLLAPHTAAALRGVMEAERFPPGVVAVLDLEPRRLPTGAVGRIQAFRDDAFLVVVRVSRNSASPCVSTC